MDQVPSREGIEACNCGLLIGGEPGEELECNAAEEQSMDGCSHEQRRRRGRPGRRGGRAIREADKNLGAQAGAASLESEDELEVSGAGMIIWELG